MKKVLLTSFILSSVLAFAGDGVTKTTCESASKKTQVEISYADSGDPRAKFLIKKKDGSGTGESQFGNNSSDEIQRAFYIVDQLKDGVFTAKGENGFEENHTEGFEFWALPKTVKGSGKSYTFSAKVTGTDPRTGEPLKLDGGQTEIQVECKYSYSN